MKHSHEQAEQIAVGKMEGSHPACCFLQETIHFIQGYSLVFLTYVPSLLYTVFLFRLSFL